MRRIGEAKPYFGRAVSRRPGVIASFDRIKRRGEQASGLHRPIPSERGDSVTMRLTRRIGPGSKALSAAQSRLVGWPGGSRASRERHSARLSPRLLSVSRSSSARAA